MENLVARPSFWQGKRVMVTGHTGFKGSWLTLWLKSMGAEVIGYALAPPTSPSLYESARVADGIVSILADIRDPERLNSAVATHRPEIILHLAAQSLVRPSYDDRLATYAINVMGTVHLLEAVRKAGCVRAMVNVTSDKCYENREWVWPYRENEALGGYDPYSNSKACSELITSAYRNSFFGQGTALASARAGNVIGGGDWAQDRLIPDIMRAFLAGCPVTIRNPGAIRPWQHVLEPLNGYLLLAEKLWEGGQSFAEAWNFGPPAEDARSVSWIVDRLSAQWGEGTSCEHDRSEQPHEAGVLKLDSSKARARLGWKPRLSLAATLEWVADWYHAHGQHQDMRRITEQQLVEYQTLKVEA
jgi:CDP-glucose 4,6-dehydratase